MAIRSGGQALVDTLMALGARRGFGVPGESYLAVLDAFCDHKGFQFITCRHEGGASFMAEAHAKLTGEVGLCFVTRGPGATNAAIGVHTAMQASTPMILFVGQVGLEHQNREAFQELDYTQVFGGIAKWTVQITQAARVPELVLRAWTIAQSGRPGPVVVALPENMLRETAQVSIPKGAIPLAAPAPQKEAMEQIFERLRHAKRPVFLVGGGGWQAAGKDALQKAAKRANIPVVTAMRFIDLFDNHLPQYAGDAGVAMAPAVCETLGKADVIIAVGVRFGEMTTATYTLFNAPRQDQWIAQSHLSGDEIGKAVTPDLALVAGPNEIAAALANADISGDWVAWTKNARTGFEAGQNAPPQSGDVDMAQIVRHVQKYLQNDAIVTSGAGNFGIWTNKYIQYGKDQRLLAPQAGAMGYGLPAAIAAKIEHPKRQVICFAGDGDFQMNHTELGTAMQHKARPIVLIVNNQSYGTIRMHQEKHYPMRVSGTRLQNPNFCALGAAYGMYSATVTQTAQFEDAWTQALQSPTGAVLDLHIDTNAISPTLTIDELRTKSEKS